MSQAGVLAESGSVSIPVSVPNGGTGDSSFTAYAVITGGTTSTSPLQSVSGVGTAGQVLTSNGAGALPTWQAGGGGGGVSSLAGDSGGALTGALTLTSTATAGVSTSVAGSGTALTLHLSDVNNNLILGANSGNAAISSVSSNVTILGEGILNSISSPLATVSSIVIGQGTLSNLTGGSLLEAIVIGQGIAPTVSSGILIPNSVIIGSQSLASVNNSFTADGNVMIGSEILAQWTPTSDDISNSILIGEVIFGSRTAGGGTANVLIGTDIFSSFITGAATNNVGIGQFVFGAATSATSDIVSIGAFSFSGQTTITAGVAVGWHALGDGDSSANDTAVGYQALRLNTGARNTAIGANVASSVLTGSDTISIGYNAASQYTTSESSNINIGNVGVTGESNVIRMGTQGSGGGQQNTCFIAGIHGTTVVGSAVLIDASGKLGDVVSSIRFKENVTPISNSEAIYQLNPVSFNYITDDKKQTRFGLIAEEVQKIIPDLVVHDNQGEPYSVEYHELPILLLREIQKLKQEIEILKER